MSPAQFHRVEDLYYAALSVPAGERRQFATEHCAGDAVVLEEVLALLDQEDRDAADHGQAGHEASTGPQD